MNVLFLDAPYKGKVALCKETIDYLVKKKIKTVGLYASVQFSSNLEKVKAQLHEIGVKVITSKTDRTHVKGQLLGCDSYHESLNLHSLEDKSIEAYLYIGDGKFHPLALVYGQKDLLLSEVKEIICDDPLREKMTLMNFEEIKVILRKYRASLMKFLNATKIGVVVTVKPGQEHLRASYMLEKKFPAKKFYYFLDDNVSFNQLENFPFIEVWVNTTCPRVGFDDQEKFFKGVINLNDAYSAMEILGKESVLMNV
jgi:2-(3-amino-3-carboxypropyl)histidine synthase